MTLSTSDLDQMKRLLNRASIDSERQRRQAPFFTLFPIMGPWRRELYPKQNRVLPCSSCNQNRLWVFTCDPRWAVLAEFSQAMQIEGRVFIVTLQCGWIPSDSRKQSQVVWPWRHVGGSPVCS
jgi:hypothetical protein